jgi:cysteine desulfurase family protein
MGADMDRIYLDNAATSFPKPPGVAEAVYNYMTGNGSSINRGCYGTAYQTEEMVFETRLLLNDFFGGPDPACVVFTKNVTESLNFLIKGLLKPGDHVLVSAMEHNAVMRPLRQLERTGVSFTRIPCGRDGRLDSTIGPLVRQNTRAVVMTHAGNVCGTVFPVEQVGRFCKEHGLLFILDTAQTAGVLDIDMGKMHIDALAFTGHKGLLGPQGIGGFILDRGLAGELEPLLSGGTGSFSHSEALPETMPDRFEAGTPNLPGIAGLNASLKWLNEKGTAALYEHELCLTKHFIDSIRPLEDQGLLRIVGIKDGFSMKDPERVGVVSIQTLKRELSEAAYLLDSSYGIQTRVGLHCAPSAHKVLGTYPAGTIRFSFGWANTCEDCDAAATALAALCT